MPFFQGAYNVKINGANMYDIGGNMNQTNNQQTYNQPTYHQQTFNVGGNNVVTYTPYLDLWAPSIQQSILARRNDHIENVDDIQNPEWFASGPSSTPQFPSKEDASSDQSTSQLPGAWVYFWTFLTDTLPRQIYFCFLLRFPSMYWSRVDQLIGDAGLTDRQLKDMALRVVFADSIPGSQNNPDSVRLPSSYANLKERWESLIDALLEEWRAINLISALLVPGILTMFQITGAASDDPVTRYLSFWSLLAALISLLYGCMFIVQFSRMRKAYNILEWAVEVRQQLKQRRRIFWNVVIMLSMPILWLTWSIITFVVCIVWFMWRTQASLPDDFSFPAPASIDLGFRVFICAALGTGAVYGILIFITFQRYGIRMNETWKKRVGGVLSKRPVDGSRNVQSAPGAANGLAQQQPQNLPNSSAPIHHPLQHPALSPAHFGRISPSPPQWNLGMPAAANAQSINSNTLHQTSAGQYSTQHVGVPPSAGQNLAISTLVAS